MESAASSKIQLHLMGYGWLGGGGVITPHAGAAVVAIRLVLGDALAGVGLASLPVAHAVDNVGGVRAVVAELPDEVIHGLGVLR
jgi:hypothetical protein